jgi:hypothetical protein
MGGAGCRKPLLAGCWAACKLEGVIGDVNNAKRAGRVCGESLSHTEVSPAGRGE